MAFDVAALKARYDEERKRRVRPEGVKQFQVLAQSEAPRLRRMAEDIWADHEALDARAPALRDGDEVKFLIAGAGMGGLVLAARLVQAGFPAASIRLVETAGGVGGTWYWNRYPGLHCDSEAYIYLPLLEEMGYVPSHKYVPGAEIRRYLELVAERHGLADKVLFRSRVKRLVWDEGARRWDAEISTARPGTSGREADTIRVRAQFAHLTAGVLQDPQIPRLPGLADFGGQMLHTARWDYGATGGGPEEAFPPLDGLRGKRVGIVGTGATAIQVVPQLARHAAELYVFQRTPCAVFERRQRPTDPEEWRSRIAAKPGWQRERLRSFAAVLSRGALSSDDDAPVDLVDDGFSHQRAFAALSGEPDFARVKPEDVPGMIDRFVALDEAERSALRARIAAVVRDPDVAAKLTPWYPVWCKRPTFSDQYLQMFNEAHVHLVDTDGKGLDSVTEKGPVVAGTEYPLDVLVLSTGYVNPALIGDEPAARAGAVAVGRGGRTLAEKWEQQGPSTLHAVATNGFPNLLFMNLQQSGTSANHSHVLETQATHIARIIADAHERVGCKPESSFPFSSSSSSPEGGKDGGPAPSDSIEVEVEVDAEETWSMRCQASAARWAVQTICTPSYINNEGHLGGGDSSPEAMAKKARGVPWGSGMLSYLDELERWREEGTLSGVKVTTAPGQEPIPAPASQ